MERRVHAFLIPETGGQGSSHMVCLTRRKGVSVPNGPERAEMWRSFIVSRCDYPAPDRLRAQLAVAEFHSFCACGCNSFKVRIPLSSNIPPLAQPGEGGMFFEADFGLTSGDHLEVLLFVDGLGNLNFVEIDVNGNSSPVPDEIDILGSAQHRQLSASLLRD
ncbi:hypothetical protein [Muricoccus nepalensis]|nr:hypothetical protein [Roseomonas nepalensis]